MFKNPCVLAYSILVDDLYFYKRGQKNMCPEQKMITCMSGTCQLIHFIII